MLGWIKSASVSLEENTIRRCFVKANCLPVIFQLNSNQDNDRFVTGLNQAIDDLVEILQEIQLDDFFSGSLGLDDTSIEKVAENLIEIDVVDANGDANIDDIEIVMSVLEDHNLL